MWKETIAELRVFGHPCIMEKKLMIFPMLHMECVECEDSSQHKWLLGGQRLHLNKDHMVLPLSLSHIHPTYAASAPHFLFSF